MAGSAGRDAARRIAAVIQRFSHRRRGGTCSARCGRQAGVKSRDFLAFVGGQRLGDRNHARIDPLPVRVEADLAHDVALVEAGKPRRQIAVSFALQAMTGCTGVDRPARAAGERNDFATAAERVSHLGWPGAGGAEEASGNRAKRKAVHYGAEPVSAADGSGWMNGGGIVSDKGNLFHDLSAVSALLLIAACKPPPDARWSADPAAAGRGRVVIERVHCAACHQIPGVDWPQGETGPSLEDFGDRGPIAGTLPNRPDVLAAFVRNAPALKPGSPMPPMPVSEEEARDIAAYLYEAKR